jgi:hypothetical protein
MPIKVTRVRGTSQCNYRRADLFHPARVGKGQLHQDSFLPEELAGSECKGLNESKRIVENSSMAE